MRTRHHALFAAAAAALLTGPAMAVHPGIAPTAGPVTNPFTGQATQVWKLVGRSNGCTAFQITPAWVMSSVHCPAGDGGPSPTGTAHYYTNDHIAPGQADPMRGNEQINGRPTCETVPSNGVSVQGGSDDIRICRLDDPTKFVSPVAFPPLVAGPFGSNFPAPATVRQAGAKYGSLMLYGRAGPDRLAFIGFNGLAHDFSPITDPTGSLNPALDGGDSGGMMVWFSPTTGQPAISGIVTEPLDYLTEAGIAWIRDKIAAYGDVPPSTLTPGQHFGGAAGSPAQELDGKPVFGRLNGGSIALTWSTPSSGAVSSYKVTMGHNNAIDNTVVVSAGTGNSTAFNVQTGQVYTACVQPANAVGPANLAWVQVRYPALPSVPPGWIPPYQAPNCQTADLRLPGLVTVSAPVVTAASGAYAVSATWPTPTTPDVAIGSYRVTSSVSYLSGPKRTSTREVSGNSISVAATTGTTVCLSIAAISTAGIVGPTSASQCATAH